MVNYWNPFENLSEHEVTLNRQFKTTNPFQKITHEPITSEKRKNEVKDNEFYSLHVDLKNINQNIRKYKKLVDVNLKQNEYNTSAHYNELAYLEKQKAEKIRKELVNAKIEEYLNNAECQFDFHNFKLNEAAVTLHKILDNHILRLRIENKSQIDIKIITGRGLHSVNKIPNLKIMMIEELKHRGLSATPISNNEGAFKLSIFSNSILFKEIKRLLQKPILSKSMNYDM